jgi:endonuclease YncB( thermonuclease family)
LHYEVRGKRVIGNLNDGDTIYLDKYKIFAEGKEQDPSIIRRKAKTTKGYLKVRLLGIDTPETHYFGNTMYKGCRRKRNVKVPPQALGKEATDFTNSILPEGASVILETDQDRGKESFYDKYDRLLVYAWTSANGRKNKLVNLELVKEGWAIPHQIFPNLSHFNEVEKAAANQIKSKRKKGIYAILAKKIIPFSKLANTKQLNEPFVYRKVVDSKKCSMPSIESLFEREVLDARDFSIYPPNEYYKVPIPYRIFLSKPRNRH